MIIIDETLLNTVSAQATTSPRKRMNFNFHKDLSDPLNRMLNALEPDTYVRPHKHENPDKHEVFIVLRGSLLAVEFDRDGNITSHITLDPKSGYYGTEIAPGIYHSVFALEKGTVVYEIKNGPYAAIDDKNFASWAPEENSAEAQAYKNKIICTCLCNLKK